MDPRLSGPTGLEPQLPLRLGAPDRCFTPPPEPDNNLCVNRQPLTEPGVPFTTIGATTDGPPGQAGCTKGGGPHEDVWFNYTAGITGLLTLTTCEELGGSATFDTVIAVFDGCTCDPVTGQPLGSPIGCNDDDPVNPCGGSPTFRSTLTVPVNAGNCYKVQIGGFSAGEEGTGFLGANATAR